MAVAVLGASRVKVRVMPTLPPTPIPWLCLALMLPSVLLLCVWVLVGSISGISVWDREGLMWVLSLVLWLEAFRE